nr:immunoglobulin heavy chain junction region [Macaca mulatta]MOW19684.1 immunoglobulin heavy chain junction region [Macaca mulatta]MOW20092.1 immunoglobulin heavy chain junction region [Macaca mulatta]MOW20149.1 immunoglobulin heavy chain junction region [Macaca mulatta]MOW20176.1 immunoglobulin heavy chain junction region [Macaca mulatta]
CVRRGVVSATKEFCPGGDCYNW